MKRGSRLLRGWWRINLRANTSRKLDEFGIAVRQAVLADADVVLPTGPRCVGAARQSPLRVLTTRYPG